MPFDAEITTKSRDLIVLEKARARIARGWVNHAPRYKNTWCIVETVEWLDIPILLPALGFDDGGPVWGGPFRAAVDWNDAPGRTKAEVLARFDAAIERLSAC